jgi:Domain of unknown function (DUF4397)
MKAMNIIKGMLLAATVSAGIYSCSDKDLIAENDKWVFTDTTDVGYVRISHSFAGNTPQIPGAAANTGPQVFMYANGAKLNGNNLSYAGNWPSPNVYATIKSGSTEFTAVLARMNSSVTPNVPAPAAGDTLMKVTQNIERGKYYTMIIVDTVPTMRLLIKEDVLTVPAVGKYRIRLANTTGNVLDSLVLYSRVRKSNIVNLATHKQITDYVEIDVPLTNDTLEVRRVGGTTPLYYVGSQTTPQTFVPVSQRIYTVIARGKTGVTNKTPSASLVTNR